MQFALVQTLFGFGNLKSMLPEEVLQLAEDEAQRKTKTRTRNHNFTKVKPSSPTTSTPESGHDNTKGTRKFIPAVLPSKSTEIVDDDQYKSTMVNANANAEVNNNNEKEISPSMECIPKCFEVERILDYNKDINGDDLYLVKWKGFEVENNSWESAQNVAECGDLLLKFYFLRKAEAKSVEDSVVYVTNKNGHKRRKGPRKLMVPPDPRSFEIKKRNFYQKITFPEAEEIIEWRMLWENLIELERGRKCAKNTIRWSLQKLNQILDAGLDMKLSESKLRKLRGQLIFQEFDQEREKINKELKEWELEINAITEGKPVITVENDVDFEGRPENFFYVNDYMASLGIHIPDDPPMGCSCPGLCQGNKKICCAAQFGYEYPYTNHGKLRVSLGTPIYECNKNCSCGPECTNRLVQEGRDALAGVKLCIFRTLNGCGWGVKTLKSIKKGSFVTLYVGEIINTEEAERRGREDYVIGATYLFDLDFNEGDCPYTVDASKYGNLAHFINHSCDANLGVFAVWVNCLDPNLPKIALFALRDIQRGQELTLDYKQTSDMRQNRDILQPTETGQVFEENSQGSPDEIKERKNCLCGSENCRKILF